MAARYSLRAAARRRPPSVPEARRCNANKRSASTPGSPQAVAAASSAAAGGPSSAAPKPLAKARRQSAHSRTGSPQPQRWRGTGRPGVHR